MAKTRRERREVVDGVVSEIWKRGGNTEARKMRKGSQMASMDWYSTSRNRIEIQSENVREVEVPEMIVEVMGTISRGMIKGGTEVETGIVITIEGVEKVITHQAAGKCQEHPIS